MRGCLALTEQGWVFLGVPAMHKSIPEQLCVQEEEETVKELILLFPVLAPLNAFLCCGR